MAPLCVLGSPCLGGLIPQSPLLGKSLKRLLFTIFLPAIALFPSIAAQWFLPSLSNKRCPEKRPSFLTPKVKWLKKVYSWSWENTYILREIQVSAKGMNLYMWFSLHQYVSELKGLLLERNVACLTESSEIKRSGIKSKLCFLGVWWVI